MKCALLVAGLATVVALASGPAVAACKYVNDGEWRSGHSSAESSLNAGVDGLGAAVSQQQTINTQILTSIIAVLTKQKSLDGDQNATAARAAAQALAATSSEIMRRQALSETVENYGPPGQALDPCVTAEKGAAAGRWRHAARRAGRNAEPAG